MIQDLLAKLTAEYEKRLALCADIADLARRQSALCLDGDFSAALTFSGLEELTQTRQRLQEAAEASRALSVGLLGDIRHKLRLGEISGEILAQQGYPGEARRLQAAMDSLAELLSVIAALDAQSTNALRGRLAPLREELSGISRQRRAGKAYAAAALPPEGYYPDINRP